MHKSKIFFIGILVAVLLQSAAFGWMVKGHFDDLKRGVEVVMQSTMRDPRDFFRGHYTRINLTASRITSTDTRIEKKVSYGPAFLILKKGDHFWVPDALVKSQPSDGIYLAVRVITIPRAKTNDTGEPAVRKVSLDLGINRYYAAKKRALDLEKRNLQGKLGLILSVLPNGKSKIKGVSIDKKLIYDW